MTDRPTDPSPAPRGRARPTRSLGHRRPHRARLHPIAADAAPAAGLLPDRRCSACSSRRGRRIRRFPCRWSMSSSPIPALPPSEVANLISEPLERLMSELSGVKHVYSMSREGLSMVTVRFDVGEQMEPSLVKLYDKLYSHMDADSQGRHAAARQAEKHRRRAGRDGDPDFRPPRSRPIAQARPRRRRSGSSRCPTPARASSSAAAGSRSASTSTRRDWPPTASRSARWPRRSPPPTSACPAGDVVDGSKWFNVYTGAFLGDLRDIENLVVAVDQNRPVFLRDVANVTQGESETKAIVDHTGRMEDGQFRTEPGGDRRRRQEARHRTASTWPPR